jgi:protein-L-isoaspartate(D-aspartate) O-methyltransferase
MLPRIVLFISILGFGCLGACDNTQSEQSRSLESNADPNLTWHRPRTKERLDERRTMVRQMKYRYGLKNPRILEVMENVPRHWFVPANVQSQAYADHPLPIGHDQTISQPYIVAYMTSLLDLDPNVKVLEIGTGSGYQAAVLAELTPHVYTIEIVKPLAERAQQIFKEHGYKTIKAKYGDGYLGWPQFAPFDAIIVTCAPDHIPQPLIDQLKPEGQMCIPVGGVYQIQHLMLVTKQKDGELKKEIRMPVRFVPLTREKK